MKRVLTGIVFALFSAYSFGMTLTCQDPRGSNDDRVVLTEEKCSPKVLPKVPPEYRKDFRRAIGHVGGKTFVACWGFNVTKGIVVVVYEDGDVGMFTPNICRKDTEV